MDEGDNIDTSTGEVRSLGRNRARSVEDAAESSNTDPVASAANFKRLYPTGNNRFEGECVTAEVKSDGTIDLSIRSISRSDGRIFGHGKMQSFQKKHDRMPDFRGSLTDAHEDGDPPPMQYETAAWWKTIRSGDQSGEKYLLLELKPTEGKPQVESPATPPSVAQSKVTPIKSGPAKPHPAPNDSKKSEPLSALLVEVFEMTGQKLTVDDPLVVAALVQSSLVKRAGDHAAASLQDAVVQAVAELAQAVKVERETAGNLDRTMAQAFQQITDGAKKAGDSELTTMQTRFARMASETLEQVRKEAGKAAPGGLWWKYSSVLLGGIVFGLLVGFVLGKAKTPKITNEQVRLMHNGMLLDAAWSKLPKVSREMIEASGLPGANASGTGDETAGKGKK